MEGGSDLAVRSTENVLTTSEAAGHSFELSLLHLFTHTNHMCGGDGWVGGFVVSGKLLDVVNFSHYLY